MYFIAFCHYNLSTNYYTTITGGGAKIFLDVGRSEYKITPSLQTWPQNWPIASGF